MKKKILLSLMLAILSVFILTSCAKRPDYVGAFSQDEFLLSRNESLTLADNFEVKGIDLSKVTFSLSNDNAQIVDGNVVAKKTGRVVVKASANGKVFASSNIAVKAQFDAISSVTVDENGMLAWKEAYMTFENQLFKAQGYTVSINGIGHTVNNNQISLPDKGEYDISIVVNGLVFVDESPASRVFQINYGVMQQASEITIENSQNLKNQTSQINWAHIEGAKYNIFANGTLIKNEITDNYFSFDFSNFGSGDIVNFKIQSLDPLNKLMPSVKTFSVTKLQSSPVTYESGLLKWNSVVNKSKFRLYYENESDHQINGYLDEEDFLINGDYSCVLPNLNKGIYNIYIFAVGGESDGNLYANSETTTLINVAKLSVPQFVYEVVGKDLVVTFDEDDYVKNYNLVIKSATTEKEYDLSISQNKVSIDLSPFEEGTLSVDVQAKYNTGAAGVEEITMGHLKSTKIIPSDYQNFSVYKLAQIEEVTHELKDGNSLLSFVEVLNADSYRVFINDTLIENVHQEVKNGIVYITISNLAMIAPESSAYNFKVEAYRQANDAIVSSHIKTVEILSNTTKHLTQTNGYYTWNNLDNPKAQVYYEIFQSDISNAKGSLIQSGVALTNQNNDKLGLGYYVIDVYTKSLDTNLYLDSNFYNTDNYFSDNFIVYENLSQPVLNFVSALGKLEISTVAHAGEYQIYLNGEYLSSVFSTQENTTLTFTQFGTSFGDAGDYSIDVKAVVSDDEDKNLYKDSHQSSIIVSRLDKPTFTLDEEENLTVIMPTGADYVVIKNGEVILNPEKQTSINISDIEGASQLRLEFVAIEKIDNHYYLSSDTLSANFNRISRPTALRYDNGKVLFENVDHDKTSQYRLSITFITNNASKSYAVIHESATFDLQAYIDGQCQVDLEFKAFYSQAKEIEIKVIAFTLGEVENVYYLPSHYGYTNLGKEALTTTALAPTQVSFDTSTKNLSWTATGAVGTTYYSIYLDGQLLAEHVTAHIYDLKAIDFSTAKTITLIAKNSNYLTSSKSNEVIIKQILPIKDVTILTNGTLNGNVAQANVGEANKISINDVAKEFNLNFSVNLAAYGPEYKLSLFFVGADMRTTTRTESGVVITENRYFIDSTPVNFTFVDLAQENVSVTLESDKLSWTALAQEWKGSANHLSYNVIINDKEFGLVNVAENFLSLSNETLFNLNAGQYTFKVISVLPQSYVLSLVEGEAVGYFGEKLLGQQTFKKLARLEGETISMVDGKSGDSLTQKLNSIVQIEWEDVWKDSANTYFKVKIPDLVIGGKVFEITVKAGDKNSLLGYELKLDSANNKYIFMVNNRLDSFLYKGILFPVGKSEIQVQTISAQNISSNFKIVEFYRLQDFVDVEISDQGVLTMSNTESGLSYLVSLTMGGETQIFNTEKQVVDLLSLYIGDKMGAYTINVIAYGLNNIPQQKIHELTGYRLKGLQSALVNQSGEIELSIHSEAEGYSDVEFVAKYDGVVKSFTPTLSESVFKVSTSEILSLFEILEGKQNMLFEFGVRRAGSINSNYLPATFSYVTDSEILQMEKRRPTYEKSIYAVNENGDYGLVKTNETDLTQDYIVIFGEVANTTGLLVEIKYTDDMFVEQTEILAIDIADIRGFWVTINGKQYFSKVESLEAGAVNQPCFAINVTQALAKFGFNSFVFELHRIGVVNEVVTNFGKQSVSYSKLQTVQMKESFAVNGNILSWKGVEGSKVNGYFINLYNANGTLYRKTFVDNGTSYDISKLIDDENLVLNFSLTTVSLSADHAASNETIFVYSNLTKYLQLEKYQAPSKLQVTNGNMHFQSFTKATSELLADIASLYQVDNQKLIQYISEKTYKAPFTFKAISIAELKIKMMFVGEKNYFITVKAIDLIGADFDAHFTPVGASSDVTYKQALQTLVNSYGGTVMGTAVKKLYEALDLSTKGLSNNQMLFDDNGDQITRGIYDVKLMQEGRAIDKFASYVALPSDYCIATQIAVTQSPVLKLEVSKDASLKNIYSLGFSPVKLLSTDTANAKAYVLNFRQDGEFKFAFDITYSDKWQIKIGENYFNLTEKDGRICLVLDDALRSALRNQIDGKEYDLSVYAQGNDYSVNSKTQTIKFALLEFDYASLALQEGEFNWRFESGNKYGTMINYKLNTNTEVNSMVVTDPRLNLPSSGFYDYISFMAYGGIGVGGESMYVDSPAYVLSNLYKRSTPSVAVNKGVFELRVNDVNYYKKNNFMVENNESIANNIKGLKFATLSYRAGGIGDAYKATESGSTYNGKEFEKAKNYLFKSIGTTCLVFENNDNVLTPTEGFEFELNGQPVLLSVLTSNARAINAQLLGETSAVRFKEGSFEWDAQQMALNNGAEIGYKITINAYSNTQITSAKTRENSNIEAQASRVYYTTTSRFNSSNIEFDELNKNNTYLYDFTISTISMKKVSAEEPNDITSVEGDKYILVGSTFSVGDVEYFGLVSDDFTFMPKALKKLKPIEIRDTVISDDALIWYYDTTIPNISFKVLNNGKEVLGDISTAEQGANVAIKFTPKVAYGETYNFSVYAYIQGEQLTNILLDSDKVVIEEIYKLKDIESKYISLKAHFGLDNQFINYKLSFEDYFKEFYSQDASTLNIKMFVNGAEFSGFKFGNLAMVVNVLTGKTLGYDSISKNLTLPSDAKIKFKAVAAENISKKSLSSSMTDEFDLLSSDFILGDANYGDKLEWNVQDLNFSWTDGVYQVGDVEKVAQIYMLELQNGKLQAKPISNDTMKAGASINPAGSQIVDSVTYLQLEKDANRYIRLQDVKKVDQSSGREYMIVLTYKETIYVEQLGQYANAIEVAYVNANSQEDLIYSPKNMGTIIKAEIYKRESLQSFYSKNTLTRTLPAELNMFEKGDGSESNPYLIASAEQFRNISQRNDKQYYFALKTDITLDLDSFVVQDFKGILNGKNHTLSLNIQAGNDVALSLSLPNDFVQNTQYKKAGAIFYSISSMAKVFDVKINLNLVGLQLSETAMLTSLAIINYGLIENVEVTNITPGFVNTNRTLLSGLTIQNYGKITGCNNIAALKMTNDNLVYAGFAITNINTNNAFIGLIQESVHSGNISIQTRLNNASVWVAGIAINMLASAKILRCGNDGSIVVTRPANASASVSVAGIVIEVKATSTLQFCYNNKEVSTNASTTYVAGVVYSVVNSTVGTLADTFGQKVASSCASVTNKGGCYALSGFTTDGLNNVAMSNVEVAAGNGKTFKITSSEVDGINLYLASIQ